MCKRFDEWSEHIKGYCDVNGLDFEKAKKLSKSWGIDDLMLLYYDSECEVVKKGLGLLDETPMPLVLYIKKEPNGKLVFEQTEYTKKYLS